jgi:hypothetical protein
MAGILRAGGENLERFRLVGWGGRIRTSAWRNQKSPDHFDLKRIFSTGAKNALVGSIRCGKFPDRCNDLASPNQCGLGCQRRVAFESFVSFPLLAAAVASSKGRLIRCTVLGLTPKRLAILRTPPPVSLRSFSAARMRFSSSKGQLLIWVVPRRDVAQVRSINNLRKVRADNEPLSAQRDFPTFPHSLRGTLVQRVRQSPT